MQKFYNKLTESKWSYNKTRFVIISAVATIWFLIRVIPKPTRAGYPCMKTAAPFMSALVIYLLSILGGGAALSRFKLNWRKTNYGAAFGFILLAIGASLLFFVNNSNFSFSSNTVIQNDPVNQPIGQAIGYYPGRVVWVHNPDATDEACKNIKGDYWFQNTDKAVVLKMMDDAILNLTDSKTTSEGWDKLFRNFNIRHGKGKIGYQSGEKIVIKINTTNTSETQYEYGARMDATPEVLYALLKHLIDDVGVKPENIVAGDPYRLFANPLWNLCHTAFPNVHYIDGQGKNGREQTKISTVEALKFSDEKYRSRLPADYMDAAYLINLPCLKSHGSAGISVSAKNHQGSVLASDQNAKSQSASHLHYDFPDADHDAMNQYRHLVDYMGHEKLGGNTLLYLVDAIWSGTDWNGAVEKWGMKPFNKDYTSSLFLSQDGVAIESVCYDFLFAEYSSNTHKNAYGATCDFPLWPAAQDYIHQAASSAYWPDGLKYDPEGDGKAMESLGVTEHWNNSTSKQYSDNLTGVSGGIQLVSVPASLVASEPIQYDPLPLHFDNTSVGSFEQANVKVFPNPFTDRLTIELPDQIHQMAEVYIFDNSGKVVYRKMFSPDETIQATGFSHLSKGIYVVKIISGNKTYISTVCK